MEINGEAKLIRIFIGESDKIGHIPAYEKIVLEARRCGLAGATVFKGIMGFGRNSVIHTSKILRLSEDLPLIIEIVDEIEKVENFLKELHDIFEQANCGGLITMEKVEIIKYIASENNH